MPRRSEPHSPSSASAPDVVEQESGVRWAPIKTNRALLQATHAAKTGETPLEGQRGADPRNGGRCPQNQTGANPRTGFQVPYAVLLNNVRHLELSEVVPLRL